MKMQVTGFEKKVKELDNNIIMIQKCAKFIDIDSKICITVFIDKKKKRIKRLEFETKYYTLGIDVYGNNITKIYTIDIGTRGRWALLNLCKHGEGWAVDSCNISVYREKKDVKEYAKEIFTEFMKIDENNAEMLKTLTEKVAYYIEGLTSEDFFMVPEHVKNSAWWAWW